MSKVENGLQILMRNQKLTRELKNEKKNDEQSKKIKQMHGVKATRSTTES